VKLVDLTPESVKLGMLKPTSNILKEIKKGQKEDAELVDRVVLLNQGKIVDFRLDQHGVLMFCDRVFVPDVLDEDVSGSKEVVLVAWNEEEYNRVCVCLFGLSEVED